jgi:signal transduction histidine kinase
VCGRPWLVDTRGSVATMTVLRALVPRVALVDLKRPVTGRYGSFALLVRAARPEITASFSRRFDDSFGFVADDHGFRAEMMKTATRIIDDVERSLNAGEVRIDDEQRADARAMVRADSFLSPADGLSASAIFLNVAISSLVAILAENQELLPGFKVAVDALSESVSMRMQAVAQACGASLIERDKRARSDERQRIARELHDRVGEALSVGLRRLELQEIYGAEGDSGQDDLARDVLVDAMRRLRTVMSGLREVPVRGLEEAFTEYLDSVQADAEVQLHISGDEKWAPPVILDEVVLILKEALRNALKHGAPQFVVIGVEVGRDELRGWVLDDGRGFVSTRAPVGVGLASMKERAALIGGRLSVLSMPGLGTRVELRVPLEGYAR